jgi:hypothetical protein
VKFSSLISVICIFTTSTCFSLQDPSAFFIGNFSSGNTTPATLRPDSSYLVEWVCYCNPSQAHEIRIRYENGSTLSGKLGGPFYSGSAQGSTDMTFLWKPGKDLVSSSTYELVLSPISDGYNVPFSMAYSRPFTISNAPIGGQIAFTSPGADAFFIAGESNTISWTGSTTGPISLYLDKDNIRVETIKTNLTNTGSYVWVVPVAFSKYDMVTIEMELSDKSTKKSSPFRLVSRPQFLSPAQGDTVKYDASGEVLNYYPPVKLSYYPVSFVNDLENGTFQFDLFRNDALLETITKFATVNTPITPGRNVTYQWFLGGKTYPNGGGYSIKVKKVDAVSYRWTSGLFFMSKSSSASLKVQSSSEIRSRSRTMVDATGKVNTMPPYSDFYLFHIP